MSPRCRALRKKDHGRQVLAKTKASAYSELMTKADIKEKVDAVPFRPFIVRLTDGRTCEVPARDFVSLSPTGRTLGVWTPDGGMRLIDVALITEIEIAAA